MPAPAAALLKFAVEEAFTRKSPARMMPLVASEALLYEKVVLPRVVVPVGLRRLETEVILTFPPVKLEAAESESVPVPIVRLPPLMARELMVSARAPIVKAPEDMVIFAVSAIWLSVTEE